MSTDRKTYLPVVYNVCFAAFMATLDSYIVNVSLPTIARSYHISMGAVSLVVLGYLLSLTSTTLIFGKLADTLGLKKMFILGYLVFVLGSFFCGISPGIYYLVASRFIQGVGGAMIIISGYAIIPRFLPRDIRGRAYGTLSVVAALGVTVGTPLGGIITGYLSWHWIFLINVPIGLMAVIFSFKTLPDDQPPKSDGKPAKIPFDFPGAVLSFLSILALVTTLNQGRQAEWRSPLIVIGFAVFLISLGAFVYTERKSRDPLLDLEVFRNIPFDFAIIAATGAIIFLAGNNFLLPFYLEFGKHLKPQETGFLLMIYSLATMILGPFAGRLSDRVNPALLCTIGMLSSAIACLFFALTLHYGNLLPIIIFLFWLGLSYGLFVSPNNNLIMSLVPEDKQGTASGIYGLFSRLGLILGVCIFETLFSSFIPVHNGSLSGGKMSLEVMGRGFTIAYLCGFLLCFASMVVSSLSLFRKNRRKILPEWKNKPL